MPSYPDDPAPIFSERAGAAAKGRRSGLIVVAVLFALFLLVHNTVPLYTDWLWFGEVHCREVFTTTILAKTILFFAGALAFFLVFYLNVRHARRLAPETADRYLIQNFGAQWGQTLQRGIGWILMGIAAFLALWAGRLCAENWSSALEFLNATPFGVTDPVFHNDVGFYVFRVPFWEAVWSFALWTIVATGVAVAAIHYAHRVIETMTGLRNLTPGVRNQALFLAGLLALVLAFGTRLNAYDLLTADNGVFTGAGYSDIHYRLFALNAEAFFLVITAIVCIGSIWKWTGYRAPLVAAGGWALSLVVLGNGVPALMERTYVEPNQFTAEQEYIARNISFTRQGFGLNTVRRIDNFPADESLTSAALKTNRDTLDNVRLWDYPFLGKVYTQTQTVKNYYEFRRDRPGEEPDYNIAIDRYPIGGRMRQVMLSAREMNTAGLQGAAQTWQNTRMGYTHGYGLVMSPVNKVVQGGPDYFIQGFPPTSSPEAAHIQVKEPRIYYGQRSNDYVFVDTAQQEFDYPSTDNSGQNGSQDHYNTYAGKGGIRIGDAPLAKLAFSARFGDTNVLLAHGFKDSTRVLFRRNIGERIMTVAPFVQQDSDPYLVVSPDDGRLIWVVDCYTMSDRFPYSTANEIKVNPMVSIFPRYIRNSVKATVDAYDGTVNLYLADPKDPIARTYAKIFPGLLKPMAQMPAGLRAHLRYPEDLFRIQRAMYATYHVDDPRVFYLKEDVWAVPVEPNPDPNAVAAGVGQKQMEPYYVIMRLPDGTDAPGAKLNEEFLLMSPLAPIKKESQNILGWMCARCDGDRYGELVLYRFSQRDSVNGPSQVISLVNSNSAISQELTLLRGGGSTATFGNLLVIPVEKSLLYIAPLYVESSAETKLPQLQRVVVAFGSRVVMANTLEEALIRLFSGYNGGAAETAPQTAPTGNAPTPGGPPSRVPPEIRALIDRVIRQYDTVQQKQKDYEAASKELERTLNELKRR